MRPMSCKLESPLILRVWHAFWTYFDCYPTFHCLFPLTFFSKLRMGKGLEWLDHGCYLLQKFSSEQQKDVEVPPPSKLSAFEPLTLWPAVLFKKGRLKKLRLTVGLWRVFADGTHDASMVPCRFPTLQEVGIWQCLGWEELKRLIGLRDIGRNPKIPKRCCT